MSLKTRIVVNLQIPWIHRWNNCDINEVKYLREYHRHLFYIRCEKAVKGKDREIEIISYKNLIENFIKDRYYLYHLWLCKFGNMSCEMIAEELLKKFNLDLCEVLEDWENGALISK